MINQYEQDNEKGLFTFYREQAQFQEKLKKQKRQRKLQRQRQKQQIQIQKQLQRKALQQKQEQKRKQQKLEQQNRKKYLQSIPRKPLYQPRYRKDKYDKKRIGQSVIIVHTQKNKALSTQKSRNFLRSKQSLRKIEYLINSKNNNRYFLQNKQLPFAFGNSSLEKQITEDQDQRKVIKPVSIKLSYFNRSGDQLQQEQLQKKRIGGVSYDRLPQILNKSPKHSSHILSSKKYKSHKIDQALKSSNSEIIKKIRKDMNDEMNLIRKKSGDQTSIINFNKQSYYNEIEAQREDSTERQKTYGGSNNLNNLNQKQKKLMEIIHNNYLNKKKY